jgi:hypothetical protein
MRSTLHAKHSTFRTPENKGDDPKPLETICRYVESTGYHPKRPRFPAASNCRTLTPLQMVTIVLDMP